MILPKQLATSGWKTWGPILEWRDLWPLSIKEGNMKPTVLFPHEQGQSLNCHVRLLCVSSTTSMQIKILLAQHPWCPQDTQLDEGDV